MSQTATLSCACGLVTGRVNNLTPKSTAHLYCHCKDCQAFAIYLGKQEQVLDANGGTEICQTSCANLTIETGVDHLRPLRLSPSGLMRWHATCCNTPLFNTMAKPGMPFIGLFVTALCADRLTDMIGPVRGRGFLKYATGDVSRIKAEELKMPSYILSFARMMLSARLRGDNKRSPVFDHDGLPISEPFVIPLEEKAQLYA